MNKIALFTVSLLLAVLAPQASAQTATNLAYFGTNNPVGFPSLFEIEPTFTDAGYTQTADTLTLTAPFDGNTTLYGAFGSLATPFSFDWSGTQALALSLSAPTAPPVFLFVSFYAPDLTTVLAEAELDVSTVLSTPASFALDFTTGDVADLNDVAAVYFKWGGDSASNDNDLTIHSIQAVPEPSTWALLLTAAAILAFFKWRGSSMRTANKR
jgi:hypothetical protein